MTKVLFFGAGVLGSLYAAKLHEAGAEVALLARGSRYEELKEHGVVLERFDSGERTTTKVRVLDRMPEGEFFDLCVVLVQKTQLDSALTALAANTRIPAFLFMNNTAEGPGAMIDALGRERVLMGHVNAGGERVGHVVSYMVAEKMTMGELDGKRSERLLQIARTFKAAGFPVEMSRNIDAWKRYHVALAVPFAYAMYVHGACNFSLSRNREDVKRCLQGIREAFQVLRALEFPVEPPKFRWIFSIPDLLMVPLFQLVLRSKIADIGMARHLRNARDEMEKLSAEFQVLVRKAGVKTPVLDDLRQGTTKSKPSLASERLVDSKK